VVHDVLALVDSNPFQNVRPQAGGNPLVMDENLYRFNVNSHSISLW
jgi:hypothetical protein